MAQLEQLQQELIDVLTTQVVDLSMMSKIELGDDVIKEIKRLNEEIDKAKQSNEQHPLVNTLQNLKDFRDALINFSASENVDGWSLSNLPTHFWETIGECINDIEEHMEHIKIESYG